jgi:hypothetical protein
VIPAVDTGSDIPAASELGDFAAARAIAAAVAKVRGSRWDRPFPPHVTAANPFYVCWQAGVAVDAHVHLHPIFYVNIIE